ncbi:ISAs1 family transposase [Planctomyces sp. SH-PL14]|uniref:ISAs1 family transposase n=1 Tax=Planctomyces sp. SH-PL14 TaxID=1632864 RepID=UPI0012E8882D
MQSLFDQAVEANFEGFRHTRWETSEKGHGRTEERTCHALAIPAGHPQRAKWRDCGCWWAPGRGGPFRTAERRAKPVCSSSHLPQAKKLAQAIRRHWSIENSQHWVLDMAFSEDVRRQQDRNGATNLAAVRRLAVSLLRQEKTCIRGAKAKRMVSSVD